MPKNTHGGLRPGAGRKSLLKEPAQVVRVPLSCMPVVKQMIADVVQMRQAASNRIN